MLSVERYKGLNWLELRLSSLAPAVTRILVLARFPFYAAICKAVSPFLVFISRGYPDLTSMSVILGNLYLEAMWSTLRPALSVL